MSADTENKPQPIWYQFYLTPKEGQTREEFLEELKKTTNIMPCGNSADYVFDWTKIPTHDVPCPCGNPNHWIVKWGDPHLVNSNQYDQTI